MLVLRSNLTHFCADSELTCLFAAASLKNCTVDPKHPSCSRFSAPESWNSAQDEKQQASSKDGKEGSGKEYKRGTKRYDDKVSGCIVMMAVRCGQQRQLHAPPLPGLCHRRNHHRHHHHHYHHHHDRQREPDCKRSGEQPMVGSCHAGFKTRVPLVRPSQQLLAATVRHTSSRDLEILVNGKTPESRCNRQGPVVTPLTLLIKPLKTRI